MSESVDEPPEAVGAPSWFDTVALVGDRLVPERADWVVMHVRTAVLDVVRAGHPARLDGAAIGPPVEGEALSLVALRHRDGDPEAALRHLVAALDPRVGDNYGSGRVTATGRSRLASYVDPRHLRAIAPDPDTFELLCRLDLGSAVIAPVVTASGLVIGALNLARSSAGLVDAQELAVAEDLGRRVGSALDASVPRTASLPRSVPIPTGAFTWLPPEAGNPVAEARGWVRRHLPDIADRRVRDDLGDDLDLVVSELVGNALRHGGGVGSVTISRQGDAVRVWVRDRDDRPPTRRTPRPESESGRGIAIVEALSTRWAVAHDLADGGKAVWADLAM